MKLIISIICFVVCMAALTLGLAWFLGVDDLKNCPAAPQLSDSTCRPADAIVAISGGDTDARAREAILLYKAGWATKLIFSGAALDRGGISNAAAMRQQALKAGVNSNAMSIDEASIDTADNAKKIKQLVAFKDIRRIILVTSPYHQRRASIEFTRALGPEVQVINHPTPDDKFWPSNWWLTPLGWWLALSELSKTIFTSTVGRAS